MPFSARLPVEWALGRFSEFGDRFTRSIMNEPTVYIVDDDPDLRDSLGWLLKTVGLRTKPCASAEEFTRAYRDDGPACLVLDVRMPGCSGLDLFEELCVRLPHLPVLFLTGHADVPMAVRALKLGALEFLEKPVNGQVLVEKVQQAVRESVARRDRCAVHEGLRAQFESLTGKEREVLSLIQEGKSNKEIAARLEVTPRAVEMRRASLMRKLEVHSLHDLLRLALRVDGLVLPSGAKEGAGESPVWPA
jgi:FixJ family two-component response regulator